MTLPSEYDSLIQDISFLQEIEAMPGNEGIFEEILGLQNQNLTDPENPDSQPAPTPLSETDKSPFPGFNLPDDIIPKEINIPLSPLAWLLCDNGLGNLIDFIKNVIKGFLGAILGMLNAVIALIKALVDFIKNGFKNLLEALKYLIKMLKEFYCASQHIRFVISKAAPVVRPDAGLKPVDTNLPRPKPPEVYPTGSDKPAPDPGYQEIFNALLLVRSSLVDKLSSTIEQQRQNERARYDDLRAQLISLIPAAYRNEQANDTANMTPEQIAAKEAKAQKLKYLEGLEDSIAAIEKQLNNLKSTPVTSGSGTNSGGGTSVDHGTGTGPGGSDGVTVTPSTGVGPGSIGSDGVTVTRSTGVGALFFSANSLPSIYQGLIADLPPIEPVTVNIEPIIPDPKGATKANVLALTDSINGLVVVTNNHLLVLDADNRVLYKSEREIIDTLRDALQKQRLQDQKDQEQKTVSSLI